MAEGAPALGLDGGCAKGLNVQAIFNPSSGIDKDQLISKYLRNQII
jgi:hypothetical protein